MPPAPAWPTRTATTPLVRLANSGTALPANDPNLDLDTAAGTWRSPRGTPTSRPVNMDVLEALGVQLSSLGFNATRDLRVRVKFVDLPDTTDTVDQDGVFVGSSTTGVMRGGRINADTAYGTNTNGTTTVTTQPRRRLGPEPAVADRHRERIAASGR